MAVNLKVRHVRRGFETLLLHQKEYYKAHDLSLLASTGVNVLSNGDELVSIM